ncbi:hypothetical protein HD554DRAFT_2042493 [Boletus coccyginus]|nr:hypothetical protein HD554DRAFT_2042493 [Boletus coccyginus]
MHRLSVVQEYLTARSTAFKESTIRKAWEKSGISVDENGQPKATPEIFTWNDYAPSVSRSTRLHLPLGYPKIIVEKQSPLLNDAEKDTETDSDSSNSESDGDRDNEANKPSSSMQSTPPPLFMVQTHVPTYAIQLELLKLRQQVKQHEENEEHECKRCEEAVANVLLAASHIQRLQGQLNAKSQKCGTGARNVSIPARIIMTEEG